MIYPIIVRANGLSVRQYFSGVWPALQLGFVSRSSMGSMPMTQTVAERNLGVPRAYASFAVPLGATTKMDGCASVYPALAAIFVAQFYGIQLDFTQYLLIVMVSVLGSAATAGTTGAIVMSDPDPFHSGSAPGRCGSAPGVTLSLTWAVPL